MARFPKKRAKELIEEMLGIELVKEDIESIKDRIFDISSKYTISAYDGAYISLAELRQMPFLTSEKKLFNKLKNHFSFIKWIKGFKHV